MKPQKQTLMRKLGIGALATIAGLVGNLNNANAEEANKGFFQPVSVRARSESTFTENTEFYKNTLGIAPQNENGYNKYTEFFRAYNYTGEQNGEHLDWISMGYILPDFKIGDVKNSSTVFGQVGDKRGIGAQTNFRAGLYDLTLNAEELDGIKENPTRLGAGLEYDFGGKINPGIGFDRVNTAKGATDYFYGKTIANLTKTDQVGAALIIAKGVDETNKIGTYYMHHGAEEKWGTRTKGIYSWNNNTDTKQIDFESITVQNPCFSKNASGPALIGRKNGDLFAPQLFENPPIVVERVPVPDRSRQGIVSCINGSFKNNAGARSGFIDGGIGYAFSNISNVKPGVILNCRHDFREDGNRSLVGLDLVTKIGKNLILEAMLKNPISGPEKPSIYFSAQYAIDF